MQNDLSKICECQEHRIRMALEDATNFGFVPEDYDSLFKRLEECTCGNSRLDRLEELKEKAWKYDDLYDDITE